MNIWFTADHHFGHGNIIRFSRRPFENLDEMHEALVTRWNECVKPDDEVYHLGDFSYKLSPRAGGTILASLNGKKFLLHGNHDKNVHRCSEWEWHGDYLRKVLGTTPFVLFHYPIESWHGRFHQAIHLHGHSHGKSARMPGRLDVGIDCWDYRPVHLDEVTKAVSTFAQVPEQVEGQDSSCD